MEEAQRVWQTGLDRIRHLRLPVEVHDFLQTLGLERHLHETVLLALVGGLEILLVIWFISPSRNARLRVPVAVRSSRSGPATVLLMGPSDGGKTSLFAKVGVLTSASYDTLIEQLAHDSFLQTHTSVIASSSTFTLSDPSQGGRAKAVRIVDLPGHPRLKDEGLKQVKDGVAVVFVVDIVGVVRNAGAIAEELAPILTTLSTSAHSNSVATRPKLLILGHKTDLLIRPSPPATVSPPNIPASTRTTAHDRLKSILTREMDRIKLARASAGGRIEGMSKVAGTSRGWFSSSNSGESEVEDEAIVWGGRGPWKWENSGVEVHWGCSALGMVHKGDVAEEGDGLTEVKEFLWDA